jgi:hypothetical protein
VINHRAVIPSKALHLSNWACELCAYTLWCIAEELMSTSDHCAVKPVRFVLEEEGAAIINSTLALQLDRYRGDLSKTADVST